MSRGPSNAYPSKGPNNKIILGFPTTSEPNMFPLVIFPWKRVMHLQPPDNKLVLPSLGALTNFNCCLKFKDIFSDPGNIKVSS